MTKKLSNKVLQSMETELLARIDGNAVNYSGSEFKNGKWNGFSFDLPGKVVINPFITPAIGTSLQFEKYFLKRRKAKPLYKRACNIPKNGSKLLNKRSLKFFDGPMFFKHTDGQYWLYDYLGNELVVIKDIHAIV